MKNETPHGVNYGQHAMVELNGHGHKSPKEIIIWKESLVIEKMVH